MVPLLAPLIGSLAGSALGAGMSTGIAAALGGGAIAGMIGAAAPAALGAGLGTLAAGGDIGEALGNAAMFGGGTALTGGIGGLFSGAEAAATGAAPMAPTGVPSAPMVAAPPPRPVGLGAAAETVGMAPKDVMRLLQTAQSFTAEEPMPMPTGGMQPGAQRAASAGGVGSMGMFAQPQQTPSALMMAPMNVQPVYGGLPTMYARDGGYIEGPGTGRSDSIPAKIYQDGMPVQEARLSDGEFVMTERAVRGAGDGDRAKGAAKMYRLMQEFERGGRV